MRIATLVSLFNVTTHFPGCEFDLYSLNQEELKEQLVYFVKEGFTPVHIFVPAVWVFNPLLPLSPKENVIFILNLSAEILEKMLPEHFDTLTGVMINLVRLKSKNATDVLAEKYGLVEDLLIENVVQKSKDSVEYLLNARIAGVEPAIEVQPRAVAIVSESGVPFSKENTAPKETFLLLYYIILVYYLEN